MAIAKELRSRPRVCVGTEATGILRMTQKPLDGGPECREIARIADQQPHAPRL